MGNVADKVKSLFWLTFVTLYCKQPLETFPASFHSFKFRKLTRVFSKGVAVLVDEVCNNPDFYQRNALNQRRGYYDWKHKPAYHSFLHDKNFNRTHANHLDSTLGDIFRWLLMGAPEELLGSKIPLIEE